MFWNAVLKLVWIRWRKSLPSSVERITWRRQDEENKLGQEWRIPRSQKDYLNLKNTWRVVTPGLPTWAALSFLTAESWGERIGVGAGRVRSLGRLSFRYLWGLQEERLAHTRLALKTEVLASVSVHHECGWDHWRNFMNKKRVYVTANHNSTQYRDHWIVGARGYTTASMAQGTW